ncbi:carbohydrate binding domain-containing protein, partial [Kitasatospora phosalacinea]
MHAPNRRATAVGAAALLLATAAVATVPSSASAANVLTNPGFETGTLSGWSCTGGTGSVVSTPVHGGTKALAGAVSASDNAKCTQTVTVQPNTAYSLTSWVRGNYVYLGVTGGTSTWTPSASDWKQLTVNFTTGASQTTAEVYLNGWYGQGTYYADDISLDGPGGTPSDTQAPTVPGGLTATATAATQVSLSWGASSDNVGVTGYDVYRNGTL